jgi:glutathione synthase/RimK-type ligase-like ATP-grasp enzyme
MKKAIIKRVSVVYALFRINVFSFLFLNKKASKNVIVIDDFFKDLYYGNISLIYNLSYISVFLKLKKDFRVCNSRQAIKLKNKNIFLNLNKHYLKNLKTENYAKRQIIFNSKLENKNNVVFPSSYEASFWENKIFMYTQFEKHQINFPKTTVINKEEDFSSIRKIHSYPVISKIDNGSGSTGIVEIKSEVELCLLNDFDYPYLIQNRLNITRDCRIVILNFEYNNHYFRNNTSTNWHPTSTSMGSYLSYEELPKQVVEKVIEVTKKLNLRVAAYDICWDNDDLLTPIIFLEVSPAYLPNPKYYGKKKYKDWKTYFFGKNPYWKSNVENIFSQKIDLIRDILIK